eukprot:1157836-Pelagomonas_calceolata.AAC.3
MADASPQTNMIANTFCDLNTCDLFCDLKACDVRYFTHRRCDKGRKLWLTSFRQPHTAVVREVDSVPPHTPADSGKISCPSPPGKGKDFGLIRVRPELMQWRQRGQGAHEQEINSMQC